jgi:electron transfer flavoprotein alpha/beta subunit
MKDILAAGKKPAEVVELAALGLPQAGGRISELGTERPDEGHRRAQMISSPDPATAALELVEALRTAGAL